MIHLHGHAHCVQCDWSIDGDPATVSRHVTTHMRTNPTHPVTTSGHPTTRCHEIHGAEDAADTPDDG